MLAFISKPARNLPSTTPIVLNKYCFPYPLNQKTKMSTTIATTNTNSTFTDTEVSIPRGPVEVDLLFYHPPADNSTPFNYVDTIPPDQPKCNFQELPHKVHLTDIRHQNEKSYTLDHHGFQVLQNIPTATTYETYSSDEEVKRLFY